MGKIEQKFEKDLLELQGLLQDALKVEHATIPPYFTAWISIMEGHNFEAKEIIKSVLIEEMLHLTLVANLLNAVGGRPSLTRPGFVLRYPDHLPFSGTHFKIHIERFSKSALKTFMQIERPEPKGTLPKGEKYHTIGQFYAFVRQKLDQLCDDYGEDQVFSGHIDLQIRPEDYYGSGSVVVVENRDTAHQAISTIVDEGEGAHEGIFDDDHNILGPGDGKELAHYYRFKEIYKEKHYTKKDTPKSGPRGSKLKVDYHKVFPLEEDTDRRNYSEGSDNRMALDAFADSYQELLASLENAFTGNRSALTEGMARMFALRNQAMGLIRTQLDHGKYTLGLDFTPIDGK